VLTVKNDSFSAQYIYVFGMILMKRKKKKDNGGAEGQQKVEGERRGQ
jgi:hypothetical protein